MIMRVYYNWPYAEMQMRPKKSSQCRPSCSTTRLFPQFELELMLTEFLL